MQYFVSIENTSYFYWQVELLIESFLMHDLADELIISCAENDSPKLPGFSRNLVNHKNLFMHYNEGDQLGCKQLNRTYGLLSALRNEQLKCPFTLIHSDMILVNPIPPKDENLVFHLQNNEAIDNIAQPYLKQMVEAGGASLEDFPKLIPFNGPIVFQDVPEELIWRAKNRTEELFRANDEDFPCEKVGWSLAFHEMIDKISYKGEYLSCNLIDPLEELDVNFVHYNHGIPPVFHKKHFTWEKANLSAFVNPYELLLEHNSTPALNFMQKVIRSYIRR